MLGEILVSVGALIFAMLLTVIYFVKAKKTQVNNIFYKIALILISVTIVSELSTVCSMFFLKDMPNIGNTLARINGLLTITWVVSIACYIVTLGEAYVKKKCF